MGRLSFAEKLKNLFGSKKEETAGFFEDLTDALIEGDVGAKNAMLIVDELEAECRDNKLKGHDEIVAALEKQLVNMVKSASFEPECGKVNVWMILGVNGVGKTTSVAKIGFAISEVLLKLLYSSLDKILFTYSLPASRYSLLAGAIATLIPE